MMLFTRDVDAIALEDLLDRERGVILKGDFVSLQKIQREKNKMLAGQLNKESVERDTHRLKSKIERNQILLLAAAEGVRSVAQALKSNDQGTRPLSTYNEDGKKQAHGGQEVSVERRA